ncbi:MAG TPA: ABC transporter permease subunit, partial [Pirellulales bacterium]
MTWSVATALLDGALGTLALSICGTLLAILIGTAAAIAAQSVCPMRWSVAIYVSFFRGTPLFIQILIIYFILSAIGLDVSRFVAGTIG